jgi:pimeloyl-ACP methyl ester carboxylesterase
MEKFPSKDGTLLTYQHSGSGSPLVLVHGTGATAVRWMPVLPALETHFTVYAINRRGRAGSGDTPPYFLDRENEDVAAFVRAIGEPVYLLGHSFGGICALETALRNTRVQKLILYEPPIPVKGIVTQPEGIIQRLEALLTVGDREGVLTTFVREVLQMPEADFEIFRASPIWASRVAAAYTLPRELRAQAGYHFNTEHFKGFTAPTLLLSGEQSHARFHAATNLLAETLPNRRIVTLLGQKHNAMDTAPDLFVREVINFLQASE